VEVPGRAPRPTETSREYATLSAEARFLAKGMADIFISYSRKDLARVRILADALSIHGWSVWWDRQIPAGRTFDQVIADALSEARCVIVVWSKESIGSDWVREEAEEGRRRDILIPVLIDGVRPPLGFGRIQAADLGDWNGTQTGEAFQRLISDIAGVLGPPPTTGTNHISAPAIEPAGGSRSERHRADTAGASDLEPGSPPGRREPRPDDHPDVEGVAPARRHDRGGGDDLPMPVEAAEAAPARWLALRGATVKWSLGVLVVLLIAGGLFSRELGEDDSSQPDPVTAAAEETALRLAAVLEEGGIPIATGVTYEVYETARDIEGMRKLVASSASYQAPPRFPLPAGRYYVTAQYGEASAGTELEVAAGMLTLQTLNLRAGVLSLSTLLAAGSPPLTSGVSYAVEEAAADIEGNRKQVTGSAAYQGPPRFPLAAGRYRVVAVHGSASTAVDVEVTAGETRRQTMILEAGILTLSSMLAAGSPPFVSGVSYDVYEALPDADGNRTHVVGSPSYQEPPRFPLPAGRYHVTAAHGSATAAIDVDVTAGQTVRQAMNLKAGILALSSRRPSGGPPIATGVSYEVYSTEKDADGNRKHVVASPSYQEAPRLPVPAGRYYVTATSKEGKGEGEVAVSEGVVQPLVLVLSGGGRER
jgi:hypothetical protein